MAPKTKEEIVYAMAGNPTLLTMRRFAAFLRDGSIPPYHAFLPAIQDRMEVLRTTHPNLRHRYRARITKELIQDMLARTTDAR